MRRTGPSAALLFLVTVIPAKGQVDCSQLQIISSSYSTGCSVTNPPYGGADAADGDEDGSYHYTFSCYNNSNNQTYEGPDSSSAQTSGECSRAQLNQNGTRSAPNVDCPGVGSYSVISRSSSPSGENVVYFYTSEGVAGAPCGYWEPVFFSDESCSGANCICGPAPGECCEGSNQCGQYGYWGCSGDNKYACPFVDGGPPADAECTGQMSCTCAGWLCNPYSPIVLDTFDEGFHLTSLSGRVKFRILPGGPLTQMSWTDQNYRNGWLALDRNGNGTIDDMTELFGNLTPQPPSNAPNGFLALAVFDLPANGGNGNGFIDPGDAVYTRLRVWIDANHNGISEPNELHTLQELGIFKIGLSYTSSRFVDKYGNAFRYKGSVWDEDGNQRNICYDVFLVVQAN